MQKNFVSSLSCHVLVTGHRSSRRRQMEMEWAPLAFCVCCTGIGFLCLCVMLALVVHAIRILAACYLVPLLAAVFWLCGARSHEDVLASLALGLLGLACWAVHRRIRSIWTTTCFAWTTTLYHQTDCASADAIIRSDRMSRGGSGLAGGGIYFATRMKDTDHKAQRKGTYLACDVALGRVKRIPPAGDSTITYHSLKRDGYDSVLIPRSNGDEYVVYNGNQVKRIYRCGSIWTWLLRRS